MDRQTSRISLTSFFLSFIAGYCDTVTFVSGDAIFSAHVTGNFVVFAAHLLSESSNASWIKLITFPVFVTAVIIGGRLTEKAQERYLVLLTESVLLMLCGIAAVLLPAFLSLEERLCTYLIVMLCVFAMGMQNAFGKLFAKETHGPTTMMTGNVTQAALDISTLFSKGFVTEVLSKQRLFNLLVTIGGFLSGCLVGALLGKIWGLSTLFLPGLGLLLCYLINRKSNTA
ncbi:MAG: DUF1275 domain-containing protein [Sporocytophaga sp.]|uniref:YoaK family protein n=1 Tax=Sporocytophaga sp. TaxID=2231183 RepID=UPI001B1513E9|nr:YoaK family protein [Sporocytophaga sp.]MBO9701878.1 DUF1275 domain-containing protein [Sporocytophaga sp.]